jgi:predicted O-methyltransferase YrrM
MKQAALPIVPQVSDDLLERYALQMLKLRENNTPLQQVLSEMETIAEIESIPIVGALEGRILSELVSMRNSTVCEVLDIGTAIGYSAIWLASVLGPRGHITSIELDSVRAERAREFVRRAGVQDQVEIITGDIFEILPRQNKKFDAIFQDVMKHVYFSQDPQLALKLLDLCVQHLAIDGLLLTDNAFCQGKVLETSEYNQVKGIQAYNETIAKHEQLDSLLFPLRDGLWFSRKTVDRVNNRL